MSLDSVLQAFANHHGMDPLEAEEGRYRIVIDDIFVVECFPVSGQVYFYGEIGLLPSKIDVRESVLKQMLKKNLGLMMSQRSSLCVSQEDKLAVSFRCPLQGVTQQSVEGAVAEMVNHLEYFSDMLAVLTSSQNSFASPALPTMIMP
ncbi:hypothetical protein CI610_00600 [invertebrate metagenome]|uniref:Uncharacterized protein n=1 Tax=invertebrate metagenome TaxID=1711999 RepID=A0A2H9TB46_9ZZZZ